MGIITELVQAAFGHGSLVLTGIARARFDDLKPLFREVGQAYSIPAPILAGIAWTESSFQPDVVNHIGCVGLMQVCPVHFGESIETPIGVILPNENNLKDARTNLYVGGRILVDHGWHKDGLWLTLKAWGGFRTKDPRPYITDVVGRASYLAWDFFTK